MKKTFFYIDDNIWFLRDLTRQRPASAFDNPYLGMLKGLHDKYGLKVQLNLFYRTDFFYGNDEFTLDDMTDAYKDEFAAAADWLKFGFHSKQEFPDYPFVNASYDDVKAIFDMIYGNVCRFASEENFAKACVVHWLPMSKDGCRALRDCGIKLIDVTSGITAPYNGDPFSLPYGHAARLLQNRKPETLTFTRKTLDVAINRSVCGYNHFSDEALAPINNDFGTLYDKDLDVHFKKFCNSVCLNLSKYENLEQELARVIGAEYIGYATHEQYFYPDYYNYQPDFPAKFDLSAKMLTQNGYEYFFLEEIMK